MKHREYDSKTKPMVLKRDNSKTENVVILSWYQVSMLMLSLSDCFDVDEIVIY